MAQYGYDCLVFNQLSNMMKKLILWCLCLTVFAVQAKPLSTAEKTEMLKQFVVFQQAVKSKDAATLKGMIAFPTNGEFWYLLTDKNGDLPKGIDTDKGLTAAQYDKYGPRLISRLSQSGLTEVKVDPDKQRVIKQRLDSLTPQQKARKYYPGPEEGSFYYLDGKKKVAVDGVCDTTREGSFTGDMLEIVLSEGPNKILPCSSESEFGQFFRFKLHNGRLKLVSYQAAG